jgi:hypothetical protein
MEGNEVVSDPVASDLTAVQALSSAANGFLQMAMDRLESREPGAKVALADALKAGAQLQLVLDSEAFRIQLRGAGSTMDLSRFELKKTFATIN